MGAPKDDFPREWTLEIGGIPCAIYQGESGNEGGITESNSEMGRAATVVFQCYWRDRTRLIAGLLGTATYIAGQVQRTEPFALPITEADQDLSPLPSLFTKRTVCTSISAVRGTKWRTDNEGTDTGDPAVPGWGEYIFALVTAEFATPLYLIAPIDGPGFDDLFNQTYCISKSKVSGEVFAPPTGSFRFAAGAFAGSPLLDVGASQIRTRHEFSVTRVRMPLVPEVTIGAVIGGVNAAPMTIGTLQFPRGSVLFNGVNPEPRSDPFCGGIIWDIELVFLGNSPAASVGGDPLDWNFFLNPAGAWTQVTTQAGDPVFRYVDFTTLFSDTVS